MFFGRRVSINLTFTIEPYTMYAAIKPLQLSTVCTALGLLLLLSCGDGTPYELPKTVARPAETNEGLEDKNVPYQFDNPTRTLKLSPQLKEISALTVMDDKHVATVQDEKGEVFILSLETGEIVDQKYFGNKGDYEGIEQVGDRLYVMRSDATIYELKDEGKKEYKSKKFDTKLGASKCNAEGLGTDGKRLILVCKNTNSKKHNEVYTVDVSQEKLSKKPMFELNPTEVYKGKSLKPSALAVHPITGNIVLLSSKLQVLLSYDKAGKLVSSWDFNELQLEQPEGLAFMPNGDMIISSEGGVGPPLLVYLAWKG
jgi:uncharacterized protein YjiK